MVLYDGAEQESLEKENPNQAGNSVQLVRHQYMSFSGTWAIPSLSDNNYKLSTRVELPQTSSLGRQLCKAFQNYLAVQLVYNRKLEKPYSFYDTAPSLSQLPSYIVTYWFTSRVVIPKIIFSNCKGVATRSENSNEIVRVTSYLRKTIVTIAIVNDFVQGGRVELYRLVALYCCILIG